MNKAEASTPTQAAGASLQRSIRGGSDLLLLLVVVVGVLGLVQQLMPLVKREAELYQMGHRIVQLDATRTRLRAERERLLVELEYRRNQVDVQAYAQRTLGMRAPSADQIIRVEVAP